MSTDQKKLSKIENELEEKKQLLRNAQEQLEDKKAEADRAQVTSGLDCMTCIFINSLRFRALNLAFAFHS